MKFSTKQPHTYGGIDLHARTMYVCILNQAGEILLHQQMKASPDPWLRTMAPSRDAIVVAVECLVIWYWLAALCAQAGLPFVLGPALYLKAIHGGQAPHEPIEAQQIAVLRRGGLLPQAYVSPAAMRATRALLRRRRHGRRKRAELLPQVQHTKRPYHLPESGRQSADKTNRDGGAERLTEPAGHHSIAVDLALMGP
jgi:transposase IS116/IS110/IS902 family protein